MDHVELPIDGPFDLTGVKMVGKSSAPEAARDGGVYWRATRTPEGPASYAISKTQTHVTVRAWGPGAPWCLARAADLTGLSDQGWRTFNPTHPVLAAAKRKHPGMRLVKTHRVMEALAPYILGQLVTGAEKARAWRLVVHNLSERAPGPRDDLWLPPTRQAYLATPWFKYRSWGVLRKQAETLHRAAFSAKRMEEASAMPWAQANKRLQAIPGIGPWTAGMCGFLAMGMADAYPTRDYHFPRMVFYALAGEDSTHQGPPTEAEHARAEALLAPFAPNRGRVFQLIKGSGTLPSRKAPKAPVRPLGW
jgi:3-methyladenine DNA glycosylase/8-oxoguanine DNA glycosylase